MSQHAATVQLSTDEALVLFELFARFSATNELRLRHNAEFVALSRISAQIDKAVTAPFDAQYEALLAQARERVADGYEGNAPGVQP